MVDNPNAVDVTSVMGRIADGISWPCEIRSEFTKRREDGWGDCEAKDEMPFANRVIVYFVFAGLTSREGR